MSGVRLQPPPPRQHAGQNMTWRCMGCGHARRALGSRGRGVFRRCSVCLEQRQAAPAQGVR